MVAIPSTFDRALLLMSALVSMPSSLATSSVPQQEELRGTTTSGKVWSGARPDMTGYHSSRTEDHISLRKVWMLSMSSARVSSELQLSLKCSCALRSQQQQHDRAHETRERILELSRSTQ